MFLSRYEQRFGTWSGRTGCPELGLMMTTTHNAAPVGRVAAPSVAPQAPSLDAVFVDLDNTLVDGLALFHLGRALAREGVIDRRMLIRLAGHHAWFRVAGERAHLVAVARRAGLDLAAGLPAEEVLDAANRLYPQVLAPRLRAGTVELLRDYQAAGAPVWVATASPVELAQLIADRLHLSGGLGTHTERRDGILTGRLSGPVLHGVAKAKAVADLAGERGWDLSRCAALSDGVADLPLLERVGHPVAINPDRALRRWANDRGWPVRDFPADHRHRQVAS